MAHNEKFYVCKDHGFLIHILNSGETEKCTENMKEIIANSTEAAGEKHIPVVKVEGKKVTVSVGSVFHPMTEEHSIGLVYLKTDKGGQYKVLHANDEPVAQFALSDDEVAKEAYAYCNLHGLWKAEIG